MKLTKSKQEIEKEYDKIINFVINNMHLGYRRDDLFDIGMIGFVQGLNTFDENKGFQYITYLYDCIKNEIIRFLKHERRSKRQCELISLNTLINDSAELQDFIGYEVDYLKDNYEKELLRTISDRMSFMTKKEQIVFSHLYGLNGYKEMTPKEITKKYGFSRQSIYQIKKLTLNKLRYVLCKYKKEELKYNKERSVKNEIQRILNEYNE